MLLQEEFDTEGTLNDAIPYLFLNVPIGFVVPTVMPNFNGGEAVLLT